MKKAVFCIVLFMTTLWIKAQDISGQWNGILSVGATQLRIVFNVTQTGTTYTSTMDSPDQKAFGIPVATTVFENKLLKLELPNLGIRYEGKWDETMGISGTFVQSGMSFPLKLTREVPEKQVSVRPQDPVKPYPYYSEDVVFKNNKDDIQLAGTLTLPEQTGAFPVVVLITGSGPQNRDEELMGHKPFLVWSDYLTRNGIAVLRFDDRGTAASTGNFKTATTPDFATDVEAAVQFLKTRKEIDKTKIGLMGHSEGGIIAPMVAAGNNDIRFIVLLAGTGLPGSDILLMQQELIGRAGGVSETELQHSKALNKQAFDIVIKSTNLEALKTELTTFLQKAYQQDSALKIPEGTSEADFIGKQVAQLTSPWMVYFIKHDPALTLQKVTCPVLAIGGSKDLQVPAGANLAAISNALAKAGNKMVTTKEFPGLNHLFQECTTGSPAEYAGIEQTVSPEVLDFVTKWILKQVD